MKTEKPDLTGIEKIMNDHTTLDMPDFESEAIAPWRNEKDVINYVQGCQYVWERYVHSSKLQSRVSELQKEVERLEQAEIDWFEANAKIMEEKLRLERENERLTQCKKEHIEVWSPLLDWFQDNKGIPVGTSISKEALRRSQEFERLERENEELKNKLK